MSRKFEVGDRVRYIGKTTAGIPGLSVSATGLPVGTEGVVLAICDGYLGCDFGILPSNASTWACKAEWLRLIYDGHEKTSWSECAWKPRQVIS